MRRVPARSTPVRLLLALGLLGMLGACARAVAPEGGPVPDRAPRVVSTSPAEMAVVEPFGGPIRIEFERTLSERLTQGSPRDAVVVSPRTGEVTVSHRGNRLEISMEGGFRTPAVYRVTVLPRFQDRYRNTLDRPVELFFSTGPAFDPTLVAGLLVDRLTGEELAGARVDAVPEGQGPTYSAVADSLGIFAFRYLPAGSYTLVAYDDLNRNREPDFQERQTATSLTVAPADTLVLTEMALLLPDTTPARLTAAAVLDSMAVELTLDDHLDPEWDPSAVQVRLLPAPEPEGGDPPEAGAPAAPVAMGDLPRVVEVLHIYQWEERVAAAAAAADDPPGGDPGDPDDPDVPDPVDPVTPDPATDPAEVPGADPSADPAGEAPLDPLPDPRLVAILDRPLPPGVRLQVVAQGVVNVNGLPDGGGETILEVPEAPGEEPDPDPPGAPEPDPPTDPELPSSTDGDRARPGAGGSKAGGPASGAAGVGVGTTGG